MNILKNNYKYIPDVKLYPHRKLSSTINKLIIKLYWEVIFVHLCN